MTSVLLGLAVTAIVLTALVPSMRDTGRIRELQRNARSQLPEVQSPIDAVVDRVWRWPLMRRCSLPGPMKRNVLAGTCVGVLLAPVSMALAVIATSILVAQPVIAKRRALAQRERALQRDVPMTVDLVRLAMESGLNVIGALQHVVKYTDGPMRDELEQTLSGVRQGQRLIDALDDLGRRTTSGVETLTLVLTSGERYGAPLATSLAQLAREIRLDQERRAERAARQLSVQLLFPVAGFILPAFALLTVAPVIAGSIGTLASSFH